MNFDPQQYWETRLKQHSNLEGVGCQGRSKAWNYILYKSKIRTVNRALNKINLNLEGCKALDIGTGVGFWIEYLLGKKVNYITGIDIALSSIEFCNKKCENLKNLKFVHGDISDNIFVYDNLLRKGYDLSTAFDVLYHITDEDEFQKTLHDIFSCSTKYIILYTIIHEYESEPNSHIMYRDTMAYLSKIPDFKVERILEQKYKEVSSADFIFMRKKG